jgi:RNA:NAD 2'-phosphotransferase (TPT1/KptA family)
MTEAIGKQRSYVLRHRPDAIGIALDRAGWVAGGAGPVRRRDRGVHHTGR